MCKTVFKNAKITNVWNCSLISMTCYANWTLPCLLKLFIKNQFFIRNKDLKVNVVSFYIHWLKIYLIILYAFGFKFTLIISKGLTSMLKLTQITVDRQNDLIFVSKLKFYTNL